MRGLMVSSLLVLCTLVVAAAPGDPTAGIGDSPDNLEVGGATPGGAGPGGAGPGGAGSGGAGPGGTGSGGGGGGAGGGTAGDDSGPAAGSSPSQEPGGHGDSSAAGEPAARSDGVAAFEPSWSVQPETGEACILLARRPGVAPDSTLGRAWDQLTLQMMVDPRVAGRSDRFCMSVAAGAAAAGPHAAVESFVRSFTLPPPEPSIPPGIALTGLTTYLVISGQESFRVTEDLPGWGRLGIRFSNAATIVDWGDGTRVTIIDGRRGAPYGGDPREQITHVYDLRDPDTEVVVTTLWRANWSVGGFAGTVDGLMTRSTLGLPVRSFEAVRLGPDA